MAKSQLTPRQKEIKGLQKQGKNAREIAAELGITENAVYQQLRRARQVTGEAKPAAAKPKPKAAAKSGRKSAAKPAAKPAVATAPVAAAPVKSEPRAMTPLQAIRARRDEVTKGLREAEATETAAERALKQAREAREKIAAKVAPELTQLDNAEAALKATQDATASEPEPPAAQPDPVPADEQVTVEPVAAKPAAKPASKPAAKQAAKPAAKPAAAKSNGNGKDAASTPQPSGQSEREATADPFEEGDAAAKAEADAAQATA